MDLRDEFFHVPGEAEFWSESHYLDFVGEALQGHFRIGFYPNRQEANLFAFLLDGEAIYSAVDPSIDLESVHGLSVRRDDWRFEMVPETVGRAWTVAFDGRMLRSETTADVAAGEGTPVEVDVEFTSRGRHDPFLYSEGRDDLSGPDEDRYEQATRVSGSAVVDGETHDFETTGERDHSWGVREWTDGEWLWISGSFEDGTAYNHLSAWPPGGDPVAVNGFWFDGESVHPLVDASLEATPAFGAETATDWLAGEAPPSVTLELAWDGGETSVSADPFATTPVEWVDEDAGLRSVMNRSPARQERDGHVSGRGFFENMTQVPLE